MLVSHAQNLEDILLNRVLRKVESGFYIDVGAYDPTMDSVTKLFYDKGWGGINIEPSPSRHERFVADRPRDINLNLAASEKKGSLLFHEIVDSGLSTTVKEIAERHLAAGFAELCYMVQADTLEAICESYVKDPIHFLKIDVEGSEEAVIRGADLRRFRPWIIVVEATEPLSDIPSYEAWEHLLTERDYEFVLFDRLNRFYLAAEKCDLKPLFIVGADNYRRARDIWTQGHLENIVREHEDALGKAREELAAASMANTDLEKQLAKLRKCLADAANRPAEPAAERDGV
jgi:FkbM family methyltransferase